MKKAQWSKRLLYSIEHSTTSCEVFLQKNIKENWRKVKVITNRTMNEAAKEVKIGQGANNKKITNCGC